MGCFNVASSQVHPSNIISDDVPEIRPDRGTESAKRIPLERETGISSESGL